MSRVSAARLAVYIAVTFIATVLLQVETPATGGYFNLGEAAIYAIAVLTTPLEAALAAGIGPAIADAVTGYWYFAPGTFAIKFLEGYIVSSIARRIREHGVKGWYRALTIGLGYSLAAIVVLKGFGGGGLSVKFTWTPTSILGYTITIPAFDVTLPAWIWIIVAVLIACLATVVALIARAKPYVLAMSLGGLEMVTGYFLYEYFISNPLFVHRAPIAAIFEVPVNIGQFVVGILLAYPVVQFIERARAKS